MTRPKKGQQWEHVLALMQSKGGTIAVDDPDLAALLGGPIDADGSVLYRLPTFMAYIRRCAKFQVRGIRAAEKSLVRGKRRKVVRYELGPSTDGPLEIKQPSGETVECR